MQSRPASQPREAPLGGLGVPGDTPGRQPAGSCLLRGVPSQGHAGWPGNIFGPVRPRHQVPSSIPRRCQGRAGRERVLSPPQELPCRDLGLVSWAEGTVRGQGPILAPSGRGSVLPSGQAGHYWEYEAKPRFPLRAPPHSPQGTAQGGGDPGVPIPPLLCSHFIPVQHWGMLVGTWCCQSPVPSTPGSPGRHLPGMAHGCHHLQQGSWLQCPRWSRARSLWSPSPWDYSSAAGCQGACGVLPVLRRVRGGGHSWNPPRSWPWTPSSTPGGAQHPQTSHGQLWPLSEPPPWGQEPQCPPVGDASTAAGTGPTHCPTLRLLARTAQEGNIWRGGSSGSTNSHHPHPLGMGMEKGKAETQKSGMERLHQAMPGRTGTPGGSPRSSEEGPSRPLPSALFHT